MSGFSYNHDAPFQHYYSFWHASSSLQRENTNNEYFQGIPLHFGSTKVNATGPIDATEVPDSSGLVCGLNKSNDEDVLNADTEKTTQIPKRKKKNKSKQAASRKNDETKMKTDSKMENEGQSPGTPERGYVYVRARRGQATDSHSLAERVRRLKVGERMKLLQSLVPGCDKIVGKAQVLDEIINYVQSLQTQLQILEGKLSILTPYASGYENHLEGIAPPATTTESIRSLEASLSCMMEPSCTLLHYADDSLLNSLVSASSSYSLTSQGDQKYFISHGREFPLWENDVQGHIGAFDQYWPDHLAKLQ